MPASSGGRRRFLVDAFSILFLIIFALIAFSKYDAISSAGDVSVYRDIAQRSQNVFLGTADAPDSEYPPLATAMFWFSDAAFSGHDFTSGWIAMILLITVCAWAYLRSHSRRDALLFAAVLPLTVFLLGDEVIFQRFDVFVFIALFLGWRSYARSAPGTSAAFFTIAAALKAVPILALPVLLCITPRSKWKSIFFGACVGAVISFALPLLVLGLQGTLKNISYMTAYHSERLVQMESTWAGLTMLLTMAFGHKAGTGIDHMSVVLIDVPHIALRLSTLLLVCGTAVVLYRLYRLRRTQDVGEVLSALLLLAFFVTPVLSPQYFVWVIPVLLCAAAMRIAEGDRVPMATVIALLTLLLSWLTYWIFPEHYGDVVDQHVIAVLVLNARNFCTLLLSVVLFVDADVIRLSRISRTDLGNRTRVFILHTTMLFVAVIAFVLLRPQLLPTFHDTTYVANSEEPEEHTLPINLDRDDLTTLLVTTHVTVTPWSERRHFRLRPDDCVESVVVNGKALPAEAVGFCDGSGPGKVVDFGPGMVVGENIVHVLVKNDGGTMGFNVFPRPTPIMVFLVTGLLLWAACCGIQAWRLLMFALTCLPSAAEMLYTLAALWSRSSTHGRISSTSQADGPMPRSI